MNAFTVYFLVFSCPFVTAVFNSSAYVKLDLHVMFAEGKLKDGMDKCVEVYFTEVNNTLFYIIKYQNLQHPGLYMTEKLPVSFTKDGFNFALDGNVTVKVIDTDYRSFSVLRLTRRTRSFVLAAMSSTKDTPGKYSLLHKYVEAIGEYAIKVSDIVSHFNCIHGDTEASNQTPNF